MLLSQKYHWLVTGGAGFIGSHLVAQLVHCGQQVTVLDNCPTHPFHFLEPAQNLITFVQADIRDMDAVLRASRKVDFILHEAAISSVPQAQQMPEQTKDINVEGTHCILESARQNQVKRVVLASSAAVYGMRPELPYKEHTAIDCQTPYAQSKYEAEQLCLSYTQQYGLDTIILRYFNVFGPGQNPDSPYAAVISKFIRQAATNTPITIEGNGQQSRDFIHVKDVVQANLLAALTATSGEIYNVASGQTYTILELVTILEQIIGRTLEKEFFPKRPGDVPNSAADISKISTLGFVPSITLQQGVQDLWQHHNK